MRIRKSLRYTRKQRQKSKQKSRQKRKTRRQGGAIHPGATVVFKPDNYAPFQMGTPEEAEELFETRNVYKL